jgi:hypothetical protein
MRINDSLEFPYTDAVNTAILSECPWNPSQGSIARGMLSNYLRQGIAGN